MVKIHIQTLSPIFLSSSMTSLLFLSTILFCPIIRDFKFDSMPSCLDFRMVDSARSVSSFLEMFSIAMLFSKGMAWGRKSLSSLFLTSFAIVTSWALMVSRMQSTFSLPSSAFVRSRTSDWPFRMGSIFDSYFSGIYFNFSGPKMGKCLLLSFENNREDFNKLLFFWEVENSFWELLILLLILGLVSGFTKSSFLLVLHSDLSILQVAGLTPLRTIDSSRSSRRLSSLPVLATLPLIMLMLMSRKLLLLSTTLQCSLMYFLISRLSQMTVRLSNDFSASLSMSALSSLRISMFFSQVSRQLSGFRTSFSFYSSSYFQRTLIDQPRLLIQSPRCSLIVILSSKSPFILALVSSMTLSSFDSALCS